MYEGLILFPRDTLDTWRGVRIERHGGQLHCPVGSLILHANSGPIRNGRLRADCDRYVYRSAESELQWRHGDALPVNVRVCRRCDNRLKLHINSRVAPPCGQCAAHSGIGMRDHDKLAQVCGICRDDLERHHYMNSPPAWPYDPSYCDDGCQMKETAREAKMHNTLLSAS